MNSRNRLPKFLQKVLVSKGDMEKYTPHLTNWQVLHKYFQEGKLTSANLRTMMVMEFYREGGPRYHMLTRLIMRFNVLRRDEEWNQMVEAYEAIH